MIYQKIYSYSEEYSKRRDYIMHMVDALISPAVAGTMYVASAAVAGYSVKKVREENDPKKIPVMGVMGAFVFAAQMINFTIPGTGSSGHLCGGILLSAILGPYAGFLTMIGILLTQCLFFADGGLLALGCNIWNMAFYGCFIGSFLIWKPMMKGGITKTKIIIASIVASVITLQMGAFSVVLETTISGISELPFSSFVSVMLPIHLAIGFVEGVVSAAVLCFIHSARPELLWCSDPQSEGKETMSLKKTLTVMSVITLFVGGVLSLFASAFPDGLEWSIGKLIGDAEIVNGADPYAAAEQIQSTTSFLPDYGFAGSDSALGTTVSGIVGCLIVVAICFAVAYLFKFFRKRKEA